MPFRLSPVCLAAALILLSALAPGVSPRAQARTPSAPSRQTRGQATPSASMLIARNLSYRKARGWDPSLNTLDVYYPRERSRRPRPVLVFIHGGGWVKGDKSYIGGSRYIRIQEHFVSQGFVFVAPDFREAGGRRSPEATVGDQAEDIAQALAWISRNGSRYGAGKGFILWGYSSGAHLAALLATDPRYLDSVHLWGTLKGVIAMDVPAYDVPGDIHMQQTRDVGSWDERRRVRFLEHVFGTTTKEQNRYSPAHFVAEGSRPPFPFLLISAGLFQGQPQIVSREMTDRFAKQCRAAGISVERYHFADYNHNQLLSGFFDGQVSPVVEKFIDRVSSSK